MTIFSSLFLMGTLFVAPEVSLYDERGQEIKGELESMSPNQIALKINDEQQSYPTSTLMSLQFDNPRRLRGVIGAKVYTPSGDLIIARSLAVTGNELAVESSAIGNIKLNMNQVKSILFGKLDDKVNTSWNDLNTREIRNDMLIIRKGDVLDFLSGVIGDISADTVKFLTDGKDIPVKREKVFGLIFYRKPVMLANSSVKISFSTGESIIANSVEFQGKEFVLNLNNNVSSKVSIELAKMIDFSKGKLVYVSDLNPVFVEYVPRGLGGNDQIYKQLFQMKTDRHIYGDSLKLGNRTFSKGLCLHADTTARYKLGLQYKQLVGTLGIDPDSFNAHGNSLVVIRGDQQILFEKIIKGLDDPVPLAIDVSKVRELSIEVTIGSDGTDLGDNVVFGGLYLLKQE